jgi:putative addiction module component (TIGR02574 family)
VTTPTCPTHGRLDVFPRQVYSCPRLIQMLMEDLLAEALRLSREERARVAAELLSSLEETDEEVVTVWADELLRRSADVREGRVSSVPWTTAREEILTELAGRRARRTSS